MTSLSDAFLKLHNDAEGNEMLSSIGIERFVAARPEDYRSAIEIYDFLQSRKED